MRLELEKYRGTKSRHTCPACGTRNSFVRYKDENGEHLSDDVGRCNRESKCGYHKKPKEFFAENPNLAKPHDGKSKRRAPAGYGFATPLPTSEITKPDYIEQRFLLRTLSNYESNGFLQFLFELFPEDSELIEKAVKDYLIGTTRDGKTVFWQIDTHRNIRTGKIIAYDSKTGKRRKDVLPNWIHSELKKSGHLKPDFNLKQCFFGEHLLRFNAGKPIAVVESEKTAVIASICFPEFVWLACGAKQNLSARRLEKLSGRQIILYPDADGFTLWTEKAKEAGTRGLSVKVSTLIETHGTNAEKANGYDLADYLVNQQREINAFNLYTDDYNSRLEYLLRNEVLCQRFYSILNEQKARMIAERNLSEIEAEEFVTNPAYLRKAILNFTNL